MKKYLIFTLTPVLLLILGIGLCYAWVDFSSRAYLYDDVNKIPYREVGVVLGTSKYVGNKRINPFYRTRIEAAAALYKAGKVSYLIVSGANPSAYYNEPKEMRKDLIVKGVPADRIQPDYAGLRTLDSVLRAEKIFGQTKYTVISQPFHNERAVFLARHKGQDVIAYNAKDPLPFKYSKWTRIREFGARCKAVLDLFVIGKEARFYGDPIAFP